MLLKLCSVYALWWLVIMSVVCGQERRAIPFSMTNPPKAVEESPLPDFSVHKRQVISEGKEDLIDFSVYAAKSLSQAVSPSEDINKEKKSSIRAINRVLVFHATKPYIGTKTVMKSFRVCDGDRCYIEQRPVVESVQYSAQSSIDFLAGLDQIRDRWKCSSESDAHFVPVDVDDPKNQELVKTFKVERRDLPLLVKETDPKVRRSADKVTPAQAAEWWNLQFRARPPKPYKDEPPKPLGLGSQNPIWEQDDDHHWSFVGPSLRQHLMDPKYPHHLPKAVVDSWTDQQCEAWHNWHHEVLSGHKPVSKPLFRMTPTNTRSQMFGIARAPPPSREVINDPKKYEQWKANERQRIRREVERKHQSRMMGMDPLTIISILSLVFRLCSLIYDAWGLN